VGLVDGLARHHVLELGAHEGAALARLDVLELHDAPELPVDLDDDAILDVCGGCHAGGVRSCRRFGGLGAEAPRKWPRVDSIGCRWSSVSPGASCSARAR